MRSRVLGILFLLICIPLCYAGKATEWKQVKNKEGIKVFTRSVSGSDLNELKAEFTVHASLNSIMALLKDVPSFKDWVYHCKEAHELRKDAVNEVYYYQYTEVPFPVSDRDLIIKSVWKQDEKTKAISIAGEGHPQFTPSKKGVVRIEKFRSKWSIIPVKNGDVNIEYEVSVDPAGWVPSWLVNLSSVEGPYETCKNLKKILKSAKYANPVKVVKEP